MIQILSGPIRSGKTTTLIHWAEHRHACGGVLSPDVNGLRRLYNVFDKTSIAWQKEKFELDTDQQIGRFVFDSRAFQQAEDWLGGHLSDPVIQYLILDEIGPLELSGKGWDAWLRKSMPLIGNKILVLVVRETLVDEVIESYGLQEVEIVPKAYFAQEE